MEAIENEELVNTIRAQNRSVSFVAGSELVNIDLGIDVCRRGEDSKPSETVRGREPN